LVDDSPAQTGLYLSFALPITPEQQVVPNLLATAIAVAVGRTVKALFNIDLDFKWINNIYYQGQKVGGILTEAIVNFETQTYSALIVGIGLNLTNKQTELGYLTSQLAISRNQVAASLIDQFLSYMTLTKMVNSLMITGQILAIWAKRPDPMRSENLSW
jgi:BirA family biotin operon repressor/biotin-[acetyl-CoA-carboxylase] ligase